MTVVEASVQPGEGTLLQVSISASFVTVAQVYEVDGPTMLVEAIDRTALNTGLILKRPSKFPEPDKVSLKVWFDPSDNHTQLLFTGDANVPGTIEIYQLKINDQYTTHALIGFSAFLTSFKLNGMKVKSNLGADIELQLTSLIDFTPGTSP
jgi:hypothetical protein